MTSSHYARVIFKDRDFELLCVRGGSILDVDKMLAELRMEREQIEEAILTLERLARGRGRRRGRPPAWLKEAQAAIAEEVASRGESPAQAPKRRGRPAGSGKSKQAAVAGEVG